MTLASFVLMPMSMVCSLKLPFFINHVHLKLTHTPFARFVGLCPEIGRSGAPNLVMAVMNWPHLSSSEMIIGPA